MYLLSNADWTTQNIPVADRSITMQVGRVIDIRDDTFLSDTGEETTAKCIILDPDTVQPFNVRTTTEAAAALNNEGVYASCRIINGFGMGGITDNVIGKHDGQCYSTSSSMHPYRVQGTEYMPGAWICAADTVSIVGDGTAIEIDGTPYTPGTDYKVILQCDSLKKRKQNYNAVNGAVKVQDWLDAGYIPVGLVPNASESYVANVTLSSSGTLFPVLQGKLVQSNPMRSGNGTGDYFYNNVSPARACEFLSSGSLNLGDNAGSSFLALDTALGSAAWGFSARD